MKALNVYNLRKKHKDLNRIFLLDEGLAQRGQSLLFRNVSQANVKLYYESVLIPDLLVVLTDTVDNIVYRQFKRGNKLYPKSIIEASLKSCNEASEIMKKRGCKVLRAEWTTETPRLIELISDTLNELD